MGEKRTSVCYSSGKEDLFIAAVEFLSHKYGIEKYTLITDHGYHIDGKDAVEIESVKRFFNKNWYFERDGFYKLSLF